MFGLLVLLFGFVGGISSLDNSMMYILEEFQDWSVKFHMEYNTPEHFDKVYNKWVDNHAFIQKINSQNHSYKLGHNQFSGMDLDEYKTYILASNKPMRGVYQSPNIRTVTELPLEVNWTKACSVTHVKDQGYCGSCWSFSTTGALEGAYYNKYSKLESFSEQQLVDCDNLKNGGKDHGCNGGLMNNAFSWISKNGGLCTEYNYPYTSGVTGVPGTCTRSCPLVFGSQISSFVDVKPNSDNDMMNALYKQPVSIALDAESREFQLYSSGVFTAACGTTLDHGVLATGYGTLNGLDYYSVKNSWSTSWGQAGYILLGRGIDPNTKTPYNSGAGQCGMLMEGSYPVLLL
jgi:KDEL-tailed cysteine endopeptidase